MKNITVREWIENLIMANLIMKISKLNALQDGMIGFAQLKL